MVDPTKDYSGNLVAMYTARLTRKLRLNALVKLWRDLSSNHKCSHCDDVEAEVIAMYGIKNQVLGGLCPKCGREWTGG